MKTGSERHSECGDSSLSWGGTPRVFENSGYAVHRPYFFASISLIFSFPLNLRTACQLVGFAIRQRMPGKDVEIPRRY